VCSICPLIIFLGVWRGVREKEQRETNTLKHIKKTISGGGVGQKKGVSGGWNEGGGERANSSAMGIHYSGRFTVFSKKERDYGGGSMSLGGDWGNQYLAQERRRKISEFLITFRTSK